MAAMLLAPDETNKSKVPRMKTSFFLQPLSVAVLLTVPVLGYSQALEEVIVTATKREASLQDVPVSVSAIGGDLVREGEIMGFSDVAAITPNFNMNQFNIGEPQFFIRGIGNSLDSAAADPAVSTFVDEVYIGRSGGSSMDLFDLERIEVLRGPQGTLFGKNVVGGAISIHTSKPSDDFMGKLGVSLGDYDLQVVRGLINGGLTDGVSGKLSFSSRKRDGYVDNVVDGDEYAEQDNLSARGQLLIEASETVEILLGVDYSTDDVTGNCRNGDNFDTWDPTGLGPAYVPVVNALTGGDVSKCASEASPFQERDIAGFLGRVDWDIGSTSLTSITAYRESDYTHLEDLAAVPVGLTAFNLVDAVDEEADQFSQEFRLASTGSGDLQWLVGLFYMQENVERAEDFVGVIGPPLNVLEPASVLLAGDITYGQDAETTSYAVFGQLDYAFNEAWSVSVGARYAYDEKEIDQYMTNQEDPAFDTAVISAAIGLPPAVVEGLFAPEDAVVLGIPANGFGGLIEFATTGNTGALNFPYETSADESWDEFLPSASVNWNFSDSGMAYFTASRGYKSGAFVSSTNTVEAAQSPLDPEIATNFELGLKSQWLDNRLRLNASVFHMDYEDLQVFRLIGSLLVGANAEATSQGLELEATALITDNWTLSGSYAYLDAEYDEYDDGTDDFSGNMLPRSSEDSYSLRSSYLFNFNNGSLLDFVVSYAYQGDANWTPSNAVAADEDGYGLVDASLNWLSPNTNWEVSLWGKNLSDEEYRIHTILSNISGTVDLWGPPRMWGVTVNYVFD
jgi:iron complex outermembrane recepter protein